MKKTKKKRRKRESGVVQMDRLRVKLDKLLEEGKGYEAEQLAVTIFRRVGGGEGRQVLESAAERLGSSQAASAAALVGLMCESLRKDQVEPCDAVVASFVNLASCFPSEKLLDSYVMQLLRYNSGPIIRTLVARLYSSRGRWGKAQIHAVRLQDPAPLTNLVLQWAFDAQTAPLERDLIIVRATLEALALGNAATARACLNAASDKWGRANLSPLLNCAHFIVSTVETRPADARAILAELLSRYSPSLERDPVLVDLVIAVAAKHFPDPNQRAPAAAAGGGGGGLMDLLSGIMGGGGSLASPPVGGSSSSTLPAILDAD